MSQPSVEKLTIYRSSAGSGKTYTLVKEYLRLVLPSPFLYRNILAVTFTNKATEEMKVRILGKLYDLSTANSERLATIGEYQDIKEELAAHQPDPDSWVPKTAGRILRSILGDYGHFSVSTIESFFQGILRVFAKELDIPIGYDIEMNQGLVLDRLIQSMAVDISANQDLEKLLKQYLYQRLDDEKGWNVFAELERLGGQLFKEAFVDRAKAEMESVEDVLEVAGKIAGKATKGQKLFLSTLRAMAEEGERLMKEAGVWYDDFLYKKSSAPSYFAKILSDSDKFDPSPRSINGGTQLEIWVKESNAQFGRLSTAVLGGLQAHLQRTIEYYQNGIGPYLVDKMFARTAASFGLLGYLEKLLKEYRKEHRFLMISDTSRLLTQVIRESDPPFVYEKAGHYYRHFLLDEFQDTSELQWENFFPLIEESLGYGRFNLLVGDIKQAIYRWRNGDPKLMKLIEDRYAQLVERRVLGSNWRSAEEVVTFNNDFFIFASELLAGKLSTFSSESGQKMVAFIREAYTDVTQEVRRTELPGYVEARFGTAEGKDELEEEALEALISWVQECVENGYQHRDIAILVRKNGEGIKAARKLMAAGIPVSSAESLLLISNPMVRWLLVSLQLMQTPADSLLSVTWTDLDLLLSELHPEEFLAFSKETTRLHAHMEDLRGKPLYETVEGLLQHLPSPCDQQNAYVYGFLEAVWEYSAKKDTSISGFLDWWKEEGKKRSVQGAESENSVVIMTIHQSKGLEFPVVILPFVTWELGFKKGPGNIVWLETAGTAYEKDFSILPAYLSRDLEKTQYAHVYEEELALTHLDNLNLLYVALTRAQSRLYLHSPSHLKNEAYDKLSDVGQLLESICRKEIIQGMDQVEEFTWSMGEKGYWVPEKPSEPGTSELVRLADFQLPAERSQPLVNLRKREYLETTEEGKESILEGILLHDALAEVRTAEDVADSVRRLVLNGSLKKEEAEEFSSKLTKIISHPEAKVWFQDSWEIRTEIGILLPDGRERRPDRVMVQGSEAVVVDYKTGSLSTKHNKQIEEYKFLMQSLGYTEVRGFLYYTGLGQVVEV